MPSIAWKHIPGYPYQISDTGILRGFPSLKSKKAYSRPDGPRVFLLPDGVAPAPGKAVQHRVDELVLTTFVGPSEDDQVPHHTDGDPQNCRLDNLSWGTATGFVTELPDLYVEILRIADAAYHSVEYRTKGEFTEAFADHLHSSLREVGGALVWLIEQGYLTLEGRDIHPDLSRRSHGYVVITEKGIDVVDGVDAQILPEPVDDLAELRAELATLRAENERLRARLEDERSV